MRTRLTAAILLLVLGTLIVTAVGGLVLIHRSKLTDAEQQLYAEAHVLANLASAQRAPGRGVLAHIQLLELVGNYHDLSVVSLSGDGMFGSGLPGGLAGADLRPQALQDDQAVAGGHGSLVYVAIPLDLTTEQKRTLSPPMPYQDGAILVATRRIESPVTGLDYFLLVSIVALAVAAAVAYWLASRFSRPVLSAVEATGRIAGGDLRSRLPVAADDLPEFAALARAINAMAESLLRAQNQQRQFLLSVSHDLRTPLTSIRGYAEAIAEGAAEDVPAAVAVISTEAARLDRLVRDLLDLARLDARRFSFHPEPVDLAELVQQAADSFGPEAATAGIDIATSLPEPVPAVVETDPDRILQILSNLVENALRFASRRVCVGARLHDGRAYLWVEDDGPGIDVFDLPRVFNPHFSSDRQGNHTGSGLGLAIVAELAGAMGGTAKAESPLSIEGGTRLLITIPADPPRAPLEPPAPAAGAGTAVAATGTPMALSGHHQPPDGQAAAPPAPAVTPPSGNEG